MAAATILLVDDTAANLSLLLDALDGAGYDLRIAENGLAALAQLERVLPDLILLDVVMPGLDGFAVCERLKSEPRWANIPVIFMTVLSDPDEKIRAFNAGAIDYVMKPVHPMEVLAHVRTHLRLRALQKSLEEELALRLDAEAQLSQSLDRAVLLLDAANRIVFSSRLAQNLLYKHFPDRAVDALPAALGAEGSPLRMRRFREQNRKDLELIVLEEAAPAPGPGVLRSLGLSPREAEVLFWVAEGKGNADISVILGTSPRTIEKHVEHILSKLGVESRLAAMRTALEVLNKGT